jgi:TonB family protein
LQNPCLSAQFAVEPTHLDIQVRGTWSWGRELRKRIYRDWAPSTVSKSNSIKIDFSVDDGGKFNDVEVLLSSGNAQLDEECLEAVLGEQVSAERTDSKIERKLSMKFDDTKTPGHTNAASKQYFISHPEKNGRFITYHLIPLSVLTRYPGLFEESELLSAENLDSIALSQTTVQKLESIYSNKWIPFFKDHPNATREQVVNIKESILRK